MSGGGGVGSRPVPRQYWHSASTKPDSSHAEHGPSGTSGRKKAGTSPHRHLTQKRAPVATHVHGVPSSAPSEMLILKRYLAARSASMTVVAFAATSDDGSEFGQRGGGAVGEDELAGGAGVQAVHEQAAVGVADERGCVDEVKVPVAVRAESFD
jgi:hypothetical protein